MKIEKHFFKSKKFLLKLIFLIYLILLTKIILFKYPLHTLSEAYQTNSFEMIQQRLKTANFIPFQTIENYLRHFFSLKVAQINIFANIFAFLPLGFFAPIILKKFNKTLKVLTLAILVSLFYESIQLLFGIGTFDVDDLILNTFGALLGFILFKTAVSLKKKFKKLNSSQKEKN